VAFRTHNVGVRLAQLADVGTLAGRVLAAPPRLGAVRLVCVDGPAGSGKTTLAAALADVLGPGAVVVHLDDLYEGWAGLGGVWARVEGQVLGPLEQGRPGRWQRYEWEAERFAEWHDLPVPEYLILEGCGSGPRAVDGRANLIVWVEAPAEVRLARGLARDGEHLRDHWLRWMASEAEHFARERTRERADVVVDGRSGSA
jgi:uridine kinase